MTAPIIRSALVMSILAVAIALAAGPHGAKAQGDTFCTYDGYCVPTLGTPVQQTLGQVAGGGSTFNLGADEIHFSVTARARKLEEVNGHCLVRDPENNITVICTSVLFLFVAGPYATLVGTATQNGVPTLYRIDILDGGEPGYVFDAFIIQTATGYAAGGKLLTGNLQIVKQPLGLSPRP